MTGKVSQPSLVIDSRAIVVIATAWGSKFGGINSFSTDFCRALADNLTAHRVICVCFRATQGDIDQASESGVTLLRLDVGDVPADEAAKHIVAAVESKQCRRVDWWLGHDLITGQHAIACKANSPESRCAVIMHMSYDDYAFVKHAPEDAAKMGERSELQHKTLRESDFGFAIGPLLFHRLVEIRGTSANSTMLVPGLTRPGEGPASTKTLHVITFGRFDSSELLTKQAPLAVAGFAGAYRVGRESKIAALTDARIRVIGAPVDVVTKLRTIGEGFAGGVINLEAHEFIEEPERLRTLLQESNVCLMLSWHEGFGLSGWEAIGSCVPLVVTARSGLYRLLAEIGGAATGCVRMIDVYGKGDGDPNDRDVQSVQDALLEIAADIPAAIKNARTLRELLRFEHNFTWTRTARDAAEAVGLPMTATILNEILGAPGSGHRSQRELQKELETGRRIIALANDYYQSGDYSKGLEVIKSFEKNEAARRIPEIALDAALKEAEIHMRLNQYAPAMALVREVAREAKDREYWCQYVRAREVENVILRDQGKYNEAVSLAREILSVAQERCVELVESISRALARSLALAGLCREAIATAEMALESAKKREDKLAEAKAFLALGDANRYGRDDRLALEFYRQAKELSQIAGHADCFLWSALGYADCLFMRGDTKGALAELEALQRFVDNPERIHPLEKLHIRLSLLTVAFTEGTASQEEVVDLLRDYRALNITWPGEYFEALKNASAPIPKRF